MNNYPPILLGRPELAIARPVLEDGYEVIDDPDRRGIRAVVTNARGIDMALVDRLPDLGLIVSMGAGYEKFDLDALHRRGIQLANTPSVNACDVADLAVGLIIALVRGILPHDDLVRSGRLVREGRPPPSRSMAALRIGIVGMGAIGMAIASRLTPFGSKLAWWGPRRKPDCPLRRADDLESLARDSDVLVIAAQAERGAKPLVDAAILSALGKDGMLVNVARGTLVDEDALISALVEGRIGGAALDVYVDDPPSAERWQEIPNLILSPHAGGDTRSAICAMLGLMRQNLDAFFAGDPLPNHIV